MWRDLFSRRPEPSAALASALSDLDRISRDRPELGPAASGLAAVLSAVFSIADASPVSPPDEAEIACTLDATGHCGPLLARTFDRDRTLRRALAACDALRDANPSAKALKARIRDHPALVPTWADAALIRGEDATASEAEPALARSILRLAMLPGLAPRVAGWATVPAMLTHVGPWCPCCGDAPALAESRGLEGLRFLRCSRCAGEWPAPRLSCFACGETRAQSLRTIAAEGDTRHRLVACASCGARLKVVSTLSPLSAPAILVAELAAMPLEFAAEAEFP